MAAQKQPSALPPDYALLEYTIKSMLQADGFGITYLARDTIHHRDVAIKEYFPADLAHREPDGSVRPADAQSGENFRKGLGQFLVEARSLARFVHPNIVRVDRYFEALGTGYMLREYEKGESLLQKFSRAQPDEATLKGILAPLLDGLEAVHRAGVLHRDIKPANVFLRDDGSPVLIDFGSARLASRDALHDIIPVLTPGYAPAEQYIRSEAQGPWSDIYSLAAVLFWAVTGEHPPDALSRLRMDPVGRMLKAARERYSSAFIEAIRWGLAIEERERPRSVGQWRGPLLRGNAIAGPSGDGRPPLPDDTRKYVWVSLGVLIALLIFGGADIVKQRADALRSARQLGEAERAAPQVRNRPAPPAGLTREEFDDSVPGLVGRFAEVDADGSGYVTTEEMLAFLRRQGGAGEAR